MEEKKTKKTVTKDAVKTAVKAASKKPSKKKIDPKHLEDIADGYYSFKRYRS